jgi:hypothetical protein
VWGFTRSSLNFLVALVTYQKNFIAFVGKSDYLAVNLGY